MKEENKKQLAEAIEALKTSHTIADTKLCVGVLEQILSSEQSSYEVLTLTPLLMNLYGFPPESLSREKIRKTAEVLECALQSSYQEHLRRYGARANGVLEKDVLQVTEVSYGNLSIDLAKCTLFHKGVEVKKLTQTEYLFMKYVMENPEALISKTFILHLIWGDHADFRKRSLDVYAHRVRNNFKLDKTVEFLSTREYYCLRKRT